MSVNLPPKGGPKPVPNNVVRLPIGDHGYTRGKKERTQREHSAGYGTEEFDVIDELTVNREQYSVGPDDKYFNVSMLNLPAICTIGARRIKAELEQARSKIGIQTVLACCISSSLAYLHTQDDVKETLDTRERFDLGNPTCDGYTVLQVNKWFDSFAGEVAIAGDRQNIKLPLSVGGVLSELATGLGLTPPTLSVISIMMAMSTQAIVNNDHKRSMLAHVEGFNRMVNVRIRGIRVMIAEYGL